MTAVTRLRSIAVAILILIASVVAGSPRAQTALPPNMTQEQYDALVNAITKSVLENLKKEGAPPATAAPAKHSPFDATAQEAPDEIDIFLRKAMQVIRSVPALGESFARFFETLDQSAGNGHTRGTFLLLLGIAAVWIYAAIRTRYGPGSNTAIRAGLAAWALAVFLPNLGNYPLGLFPARLLVISTVVALVEIV